MKNDLNFQTAPGGQPQPLNININELPNFHCTNCNNQAFQVLFIIKKVSALQSPTGKETIQPLQIFACIECGMVPPEFGGTLLEPVAKTNEDNKNDQ